MPSQPSLFDDEPDTGEEQRARRPSRADGTGSHPGDDWSQKVDAQHAEARPVAATLPSTVHFGTSSWSFPGWAGIVYRARRTQTELAREGLREYATHPLLTTVGVDRSYYAPIPVEDFRRYADQLPGGFLCCLKAPASVTSMVVPEARQRVNADYLSPARLIEDLLEPCAVGFEAHTGPIVIEFPPMPRELRLAPSAFAARLDAFLAALPPDFSYSVELRDRALLTSEYAAVLSRHHASHTYNYWSAMPLPGEQARIVTPQSLTSEASVIRLLLRPGTRYEDQRESFRPFDRLVEPDDAMRDDTVALARQLTAAGRRVYVLVNNKAEGSSPLTVGVLARRLAALTG